MSPTDITTDVFSWDTLRLGPFTDDFYQDAAMLEDKLSTPTGVDWPVIGSSGELASLMNMVSDQSVCLT